MRTREEICTLLAAKFVKESARLKSWGTKTDEKSAVSFAMAVADFVRSMMAESRSREAKRILKKIEENGWHRSSKWGHINSYLEERIKATSQMSKAIEKFALEKESKSPWKSKVKKEEKHKHKHKHKHHHRSN